MSVHPALNAFLNLVATGLLVQGYAHIRKKRVNAHRVCMLGALGVSALFLVSYLVYHSTSEPNRFPEVGAVRTVYLTILLTHTVFAAAVPFLALRTFWLAHKARWEPHRRLARWTFPIWLYVSITGVVIYVMLYHVAPALSGS